MTAPKIETVGLTKHYGDDCVVKDVSIQVQAGETVCIVGPSGAGKSTLLRCLNLLERPDRGAILMDGELFGYEHKGDRLVELPKRAVARQRRRTGMVFQHFNLFPHRSVVENLIESPVHVLGRRRQASVERAMELLDSVGLAHKADAMPSQLSGGQAQRVGIARALALEPEVMLLDEPTSALDPETVGDVLGVIARLADTGITNIIVTHEIGFAREVADRAIFMEAGEVVEVGPAGEVLKNPRSERAGRFLSSVL